MEEQNNDEDIKLLKVLGKALGSLELLVEFFEGINGKKMSPKQKQILSKVTGLTPTTSNEETEWLLNFNSIDEAGDVILVVTDKHSKNWVGIRWTPVGAMVYDETDSYMERYHSGYQINSPAIQADVIFNFNGSTVPYKAQTALCLIEHDGQYHLLGTMKIDGVTIETPLIHTHLGMINRSAVLTNLFKRLEVQKQRQSTQP